MTVGTTGMWMRMWMWMCQWVAKYLPTMRMITEAVIEAIKIIVDLERPPLPFDTLPSPEIWVDQLGRIELLFYSFTDVNTVLLWVSIWDVRQSAIVGLVWVAPSLILIFALWLSILIKSLRITQLYRGVNMSLSTLESKKCS